MTALLQARPDPVPSRPWSFPRFERTQLTNGINLVTCHLADRPIVETRLVVPGAAVRSEDVSRCGVTHLLSGAFSEGTEDHTGEQFADLVESLGARIGVEADWDALIPGISAPVDRLGAALELLLEAVARPRFAEEDVDRLVRRSVAGYLSTRQFPGPRAGDEFATVAFDGISRMAYPREGIPTSLTTLTAEHVRDFWKQHFYAEGATLIVVGDLREVALDRLLDRTMAGWEPRRPADADRRPGLEAKRPGRRLSVVDFPGAVQTELLVGQAGSPVPVADRAALRVATHYLGGFFGARLNAVLREQKAITYGVTCGLEHNGGAVAFRVGGAVQRDATAEAVGDILFEIEALASGRIDGDTFAHAVDNLVRTAPIAFKTTGSVCAALVRLVVEHLPDDYFDRVLDDLAATTAVTMSDAFARCVPPEDVCVAAAGDGRSVVPALEDMAVGPVSVVPLAR